MTTIAEKYAPDLSTGGFSNKAVWICIRGTLLLYEEPNYNKNGGKLVEFIFWGENYCTSLKALLGKASSLRFAGDMTDLRNPSMTLYEHINFQGREDYITTRVSLPKEPWVNHASMIITGNSNWTIVDGANYRGYWLCFYFSRAAEDFPAPVMIKNLNELRLFHGNIRSVIKGCPSNDGKRIDLSNYIVKNN
ncbi:unnamed protein product [Orchesella dallaii]|uniref:Uncharacterized protein n=1 Tax=Orchesella dallaii TaxID=48710 RepID=A0ABP1R9R4_9HEXA